ncbi:GntR family transcriptional regulator [Pseudofrankia inefficax]|uniref:Transcriptional regulator, GntR family n=1 Tax=Pseudofrankia inefficax (strain DSM 45817 / CECT 9037 / DDB 130130 / EuI1c) TaxID=298654 RepID=E3JD17_PSEI1|nr:GntR family transcriptional regulator [Pseudofrankia inefficax]ADP81156.1 transcriptional regulator, GntR family [Pseudofrankia inefficax]
MSASTSHNPGSDNIRPSDSVRSEDGSDTRIEQLSLVDHAIAKIRDLLLTGTIAPGERVREEWLTERLGISRPPLREAMQVLVHQGLLQRLPRRGVRAVNLTDSDIWEIYSLRAVLDRFALELGVPVMSADLLTPMRTAVAAMRAAVKADDRARYVEANRAFHLGMIALGGNSRLTSSYENLMNQMQLVMSVNLARESGTDRLAGVRRHEELLAAIESGDLSRALAALEAHGELRYFKH